MTFRRFRTTCLKLFPVLLLTLAAAAQSPRPSLEQILSYAFPDQLTAAAQGERVAWVFNIRGVRNIWVADGPDFKNAHPVTYYSEDDGQPIAGLTLTPDGRTAVYARGSETNSEGEVADPANFVNRLQQQVWAVDVDRGGEPRLLGTMECGSEGCEDIELSPDGRYAAWAARGRIWVAPVSGGMPAQPIGYVRGNNIQPRWSPDGTRIAFTSQRGDHSFIAVYDFQNQSLLYLAPSFDRDLLPRWSLDGKHIAFIRLHGLEARVPLVPLRPEPWAIWVADASTGQARLLWQSGDGPDDSFPRLRQGETFRFVANDRILFASEQDGWNHLYTIPLSGGSPLRLTEGAYEVEQVTVSPDAQWIYYTSNQNDIDRRHIWRVRPTGGVPEAVTQGETIEWSPVITGDGRQVLCLGSSATVPAMPYRITASGREMLARQALPADYPSQALVVPRQVVFKSADGLEIHGQLFVPRDLHPPAPAIVFMHGGPIRQMVLGFHYMDYYHNAYAENQYLASLGFVVLSVNYRLGVMYGRAFREPEHAGWRGAAEYQDIVAAAHYLQSLPYVDAHRIGLWGGSYGGYLTALGLARNSDLFAAGVDLHGVHDWSAFLNRWMRFERGGVSSPPDLAEAVRLARESSPVSAVDRWKSPVLLIQGDDDRNVPFSQSVDLVQRLREHHVPFETLVFPDEIHGFLMWKSWLRAYQATADFFVRVLMRGEKIAVAP